MHVVVAKKDLLRILARCQGVADKKSTKPVLGNVLLRGEDGRVSLAATDLYLAVSGSIEAEVTQPGTIAVGARDLFDRVKMMPDGDISIETNDASATTIRAKGSARRYTVHGIPGEEFPALPAPEESAKELELGIADLLRLVSATHFSISTDETRLHLNSALFEWSGKTVRMVTTDGHRLSKLELEVESEAEASMLIPLKGVLELKRLCEEAHGDAKDDDDPKLVLQQSGPDAFFRLGGFQFSVKLVDAQFPPYRQVIPDSLDRTVTVSRPAMADALKAVSVAASDRTGGVKITFTENKLRFESESPDAGEGFDELDVEYSGSEMMVGFNAKYFLDILAAMDAEDVVLGVSGELDPAVLKPAEQGDGSDYLAVVMPMRV